MLGRILAAVVALVVLGGAVVALRGATMSTHTLQDPESRMELVVEADLHRSEPGQNVAEYTYAKILTCRTEVGRSDPVTDLRAVEPGVFSIVLQPALDDTNRKQLRGCLEDWNLDHLLLDVVSMEDLDSTGS